MLAEIFFANHSASENLTEPLPPLNRHRKHVFKGKIWGHFVIARATISNLDYKILT